MVCYEADQLHVSFDISREKSIGQIRVRMAPHEPRSKNIGLHREQAGKHTVMEGSTVKHEAFYEEAAFFRATFSHWYLQRIQNRQHLVFICMSPIVAF